MDFGRMKARVQAILTNPKNEWPVIAGEQTTIKELYVSYILLLAAVGPLAGFLKMSIFGLDVPMMGTYRVSIGAGLGHMLFSYVMVLIGVYVVALIINLLAPSFGAQKDQVQAMKTVAYAYTAAWVAGLGQILPWVGGLIVLAGSIYSIYLLYIGLPVTMKCADERAKGYTAASIVVAVIFSLVISAIVGGMTGGLGMMGSSTTSQMSIPSDGGFDKDSTGGKIEEWAGKMEEAGKAMEEAQQSGDSEQQKVAMEKLMASAMGSDGKIETLDPERIKSFLPEEIAGMPRSAVRAERTGAIGFQISTAEASYDDNNGNGLRVEITDVGLAQGMIALAGWVGAEQESVTETGFEKTYKKGNDFVHEQWDSLNSTGEYSTIVAERFSVKITGSAENIGTLKDALGSIDIAGLAALKDEGVKK